MNISHKKPNRKTHIFVVIQSLTYEILHTKHVSKRVYYLSDLRIKGRKIYALHESVGV